VAFLERWRPFWEQTLDQLASYVERGERGERREPQSNRGVGARKKKER
jgi:hypothetical protein